MAAHVDATLLGIEGFLDVVRADAELAAAGPSTRSVVAGVGGRSGFPALASATRVARRRGYEGIALISAGGAVLEGSTELRELQDADFAAAWEALSTGTPAFAGPYVLDDGRLRFAVAHPVREERAGAGAPAGAVLVVLGVESSIRRWLRPMEEPTRTGLTALVAVTNGVLAPLAVTRAGAGGPGAGVPVEGAPLPGRLVMEGERFEGVAEDWRGVDALFVARPVDGSGWGLLRKVDLDEVHAPAHAQALAESGLLGAVFALLLVGGSASARVASARRDEESSRRERDAMREVAQVYEILDDLTRATSDAMYVKDRDGRFVWTNDAADGIAGLGSAELLGRTVSDVFDSDIAATVRAEDEAVMRSGRPVTRDVSVPAPGGQRTLSTHKAPWRNADGAIVGIVGVTRDVTERWQSERRLADHLARSQALLQALPDLIVRVDADGVVQDLHVPDEARTVNPVDQIEGRPLTELLPAPVSDLVMDAIGRALSTGGSQEVTYTLEYPDGRRHYEERMRPSGRDEVVRVVRDVTERVEAERSLRALEHMHRMVLEHSPDYLMVLDPEATIRYINRTGPAFDREGLIGTSAAALVDPSHVAWAQKHLIRAIERGEVRDFESLGSDGRHYRVRLIPLGDDAQSILAVSTDVEERRRASDALRETERRLSQALEAAGAGAWEWDLATHRVWRSDEVWALLGLPQPDGDAQVEIWLSAVHPDDVVATRVALDAAVEQGADLNLEYRVLWPDGTERWMRDAGRLRHDAEGKPVSMSGIMVDVTGLKVVEQELRALTVELEERVNERTADLEAFIYTVSHELKAPLASIHDAVARLLEDAPSETDTPGTLHAVRRRALRATRMIDRLLKLSRIGRAEVEPKKIDAARIVRSALLRLAEEGAADTDRVEVGPLPVVRVDPMLMREVFVNLVSNALKFSAQCPDATIEIGARRDLGEHVFYVRDPGVGFDPRYGHRLFRVFERLHSDREFEGTGVGLAVVRQIVEKHGGRVWASSSGRGGATFYFTVPDGTTAERRT